MTYIYLLLAILVTIRVGCWGAHADRKKWPGKLAFTYWGMVIALSLIVGGGWGMVINDSMAPTLLFFGVSLLIMVNKRSPFRSGK